MSEENKKVELKEDELDKVVGGESYMPGVQCPWCHKETIWDDGRIAYCKECGWDTSNS